MSRVRMHNISISLDGFAAGEPQALETPMGHAGQRLHTWMFATAFGAAMMGRAGGSDGVDQAFAQRFADGIGVEIMGAGKFGPPGWQDDPEWRGWWGETPPFGTPVLVLTHRPRGPLVLDGTTFHFLDAAPTEALARAREMAGGLDVRIGGGADVARQFLTERLVDVAHVVQVPIVLGRGSRLWDGMEALEDDYDVEAVPSPSGVVHLTLQRRA